MQEKFVKEEVLIEKTEIEKDVDIIKHILEVKEQLKVANNNFEYAQGDMIDYYSYQIKASQSKLDYLIKLAKKKGLVVNKIKEIKYKMLPSAKEVV